jgi:hypothetical protein
MQNRFAAGTVRSVLAPVPVLMFPHNAIVTRAETQPFVVESLT